MSLGIDSHDRHGRGEGEHRRRRRGGEGRGEQTMLRGRGSAAAAGTRDTRFSGLCAPGLSSPLFLPPPTSLLSHPSLISFSFLLFLHFCPTCMYACRYVRMHLKSICLHPRLSVCRSFYSSICLTASSNPFNLLPTINECSSLYIRSFIQALPPIQKVS